MMLETKNIGALILAAGASSRMGVPKQTLRYRETTLLGYSVNTVKTEGFDPIVVVTGAQEKITPTEVINIHNPEWKKGIGTSISCGIKGMLNINPELIAILIMLADQSMIKGDLLRQFILSLDHKYDAIALDYPSGAGVPALFSRKLFERLKSLNGSYGAKKVLRDSKYLVKKISCSEARRDIDTPEDYWRLFAETNQTVL